jgi:hypothetical protein
MAGSDLTGTLNVFSILIGVVAGVIGTLASMDALRSLWTLPRLRIEDYLLRGGDGYISLYIIVRNTGRSTAQACAGMISMEDIRDDIIPKAEVLTMAEAGLPPSKFNLETQTDQVFLLQEERVEQITQEFVA